MEPRRVDPLPRDLERFGGHRVDKNSAAVIAIDRAWIAQHVAGIADAWGRGIDWRHGVPRVRRLRSSL